MTRRVASPLSLIALVAALSLGGGGVRAANVAVENPAAESAAPKSLEIPEPGTRSKPSILGLGPPRPSFMNDVPLPDTKPAKPEKPVARDPLPKLRLTGMIETGDADRLRAILTKLRKEHPKADPLAVMEMSSMGGSLTEGFLIGSMLREFKVMAVVRKQDFCMSSCALAFLGGNVHRKPPEEYPKECNVEIGGKVAFHNFFLNRNGLRAETDNDPVQSRLQGFADARGGAALLIKYAGDMGLPPNFVASMMGRPVEDFQYIETISQFLMLHVCPIGLPRPQVALPAQAVNVCSNSLGSVDDIGPMQARQIKTDEIKPYLLGRVQAGMKSGKGKSALAEQIAAAGRSPDKIDKIYDELRDAGVPLPDIVGPTFEVDKGAADNPEAVCYVSLSEADPDSYDVAMSSARGFADPPHVPPENSRRLFLFDRKAVVNPKPH
jgi:hypothetical protein